MRTNRSVLVIWPPHVPSYFNAGHHLPLFLVAAYLRAHRPGDRVHTLDAGALNLTWKEVGDAVFQGRFDVVAVMNEFDALEGFGRLVSYVHALRPHARIVTFGRLSNHLPGFFERYDIDAIVHTGDYESGVAAYLDWLDGAPPPPGVVLRDGDGWTPPRQRGIFLDPRDWVLPDVTEVPYVAYEAMYHRDQNKFCGIPQRRELVVPAARGCPIGCHFCEVPGLYGKAERRLSVERVLSYIEESFAAHPFEYVAFYAPTFTLDREWVVRLCESLVERGSRYPWKCATTMHHLDEELVALMARSGCVRISVGLETLEEASHPTLPRIKRVARERFDRLAGWCRASGIELNCFVIAGLPGTTPAGVRHTVDVLRANGARVRPTMYSPLHDMSPDMSEAEVVRFNRQLIVADTPVDDAEQLYEVIFGVETRVTDAMDRIPVRRDG